MKTKILSFLLISTLLLSASCAVLDSEDDGFTNVERDDPDFEPEFQDADEDFFLEEGEEDGVPRTLATTYPNLRIQGYYNSITTAPAGFKEYMQKSLGPAVIDYYQAALKVKYPITTKIKLSAYTSICKITTPKELKSTGVVADLFLLFDSAHDTGSSWVAESYSCILASGTKRPLIGKTVLNTALFRDPGTDVLLHEKNIYMVLHEVAHVLGFAGSMFKYYLNENGKTRTGHIITTTLDGETTKVINVPPLTDRLRKFFGCPSMLGAYMEGSGSSATAGSHFERRMLPFEGMTSGLIYQQSMSEFTLAMLEGSGWYVPDYSMADGYWFGQGQGCDFITKSCKATGFNFEEFCTGTAQGCTVQGRGAGKCAADTRSNSCRFVHPNVNYDCDNPAAEKNARYSSIEKYGRAENSKCFTGTLSETSTTAASTSFCFKYKCVGSGLSTSLRVYLGEKYYTCKYKGIYRPAGYKGYFDCPDPLTFCQTVGAPVCPRGCMGRGLCVEGVCQCNKGFSGKDCAAKL